MATPIELWLFGVQERVAVDKAVVKSACLDAGFDGHVYRYLQGQVVTVDGCWYLGVQTEDVEWVVCFGGERSRTRQEAARGRLFSNQRARASG